MHTGSKSPTAKMLQHRFRPSDSTSSMRCSSTRISTRSALSKRKRCSIMSRPDMESYHCTAHRIAFEIRRLMWIWSGLNSKSTVVSDLQLTSPLPSIRSCKDSADLRVGMKPTSTTCTTPKIGLFWKSDARESLPQIQKRSHGHGCETTAKDGFFTPHGGTISTLGATLDFKTSSPVESHGPRRKIPRRCRCSKTPAASIFQK